MRYEDLKLMELNDKLKDQFGNIYKLRARDLRECHGDKLPVYVELLSVSEDYLECPYFHLINHNRVSFIPNVIGTLAWLYETAEDALRVNPILRSFQAESIISLESLERLETIESELNETEQKLNVEELSDSELTSLLSKLQAEASKRNLIVKE